jgi:hypothetical protein
MVERAWGRHAVRSRGWASLSSHIDADEADCIWSSSIAWPRLSRKVPQPRLLQRKFATTLAKDLEPTVMRLYRIVLLGGRVNPQQDERRRSSLRVAAYGRKQPAGHMINPLAKILLKLAIGVRREWETFVRSAEVLGLTQDKIEPTKSVASGKHDDTARAS